MAWGKTTGQPDGVPGLTKQLGNDGVALAVKEKNGRGSDSAIRGGGLGGRHRLGTGGG
jgi:hypothetical protein